MQVDAFDEDSGNKIDDEFPMQYRGSKISLGIVADEKINFDLVNVKKYLLKQQEVPHCLTGGT